MSDARPITNVTEFVCGSCWNGFGVKDPGVRQTGGEVVCPHCGHVQPRPGAMTDTVRMAAARAPDDDDDDEIGIDAPEPGAAAAVAAPAAAPTPAAAPETIDEQAIVGAAEVGFDEPGAAEDTDVEGNASAVAAAVVAAAHPLGTDDALLGDDSELDLASTFDATDPAAEMPAELAVAGAGVESEPTEPDLDVESVGLSKASTPQTTEELLAFLSRDVGEFDDTGEFSAEVASALVGAAPAAEISEADTEDDDAFDEMFGAMHENPGKEAPLVIQHATTRISRPDVSKAKAAALAETVRASTGDFNDITSESTAPEIRIPEVLPEPTEWKLRSPPGLTYNFHSLDALMGWASNRNADDLQVSIDGKDWRPVRPFIEAVRAGHLGRAAYEYAGNPSGPLNPAVAAAATGADGRSALDDIRDVDVRDEVLRSIESRTSGHFAPVKVEGGPSTTRKTKAVRATGEVDDETDELDADTAEVDTAAVDIGDATIDAPTVQAKPQPKRVPSGKTAAVATPTTRPSRLSGKTAVATGNRRPTSTKHTPVARKQSDGPKPALIAAIAVAAIAAVVGVLKVLGVF